MATTNTAASSQPDRTWTAYNLATSAGSSKTFRHEPLERPGNQIRLLKLSGFQAGTIGAHVSTWTLPSCPDYVAISYTWGAPDLCRMIKIDGKILLVRKHCWHALVQLRNHGFTGYFWLDALCIDQSNNDEKSMQVRMMYDIYAQAITVFIVLSPMSKEMTELATRIQQLDVPEPENVWDSDVQAQVMEVLSSLGVIEREPYWTRLWVIQELTAAKHIQILLGNDSIEWTHLSRIWRRLDDWTAAYILYCDINSESNIARAAGRTRRRRRFFSGRGQDARLPEADRTPERHGLFMVLSEYSDCRCFDPKDKIYGLLPLVRWPKHREPPEPDYTKSTVDLAMDLLPYYERQPGQRDSNDSEVGRGAARSAQTDPLESLVNSDDFVEASGTETPMPFMQALISALAIDLSHPQVNDILSQRRDARSRGSSRHLSTSSDALRSPDRLKITRLVTCRIWNYEGHNCESPLGWRACGHALLTGPYQHQHGTAKRILVNGTIRACVGSAAKRGDYLIGGPGMCSEMLLVVRRSNELTFEIVGYALACSGTLTRHGTSRFPWTPDWSSTGIVDLFLDQEDLLVLACCAERGQAYYDCDSSEIGQYGVDQTFYDILQTSPTRAALSSFAVENGQSMPGTPLRPWRGESEVDPMRRGDI